MMNFRHCQEPLPWNLVRSLGKTDTLTLVGLQASCNYIQPDERPDWQTPAEACGIDIQGKNKWLTLIQNASQKHATLHDNADH